MADNAVALPFWQLALIAGVPSFLGLIGIALPILKDWRRSRVQAAGDHLANQRSRIQLLGEEGDAGTLLKTKINGLIKEALDAATREQAMGTEIAAQQVLLKVKEGQIQQYQDMMKQIVLEQGRAQQREETCQARLAEVTERLEHLEEQERARRERQLERHNKDVTRENLQLRGEHGVQDIHSDPETDPSATP